MRADRLAKYRFLVWASFSLFLLFLSPSLQPGDDALPTNDRDHVRVFAGVPPQPPETRTRNSLACELEPEAAARWSRSEGSGVCTRSAPPPPRAPPLPPGAGIGPSGEPSPGQGPGLQVGLLTPSLQGPTRPLPVAEGGKSQDRPLIGQLSSHAHPAAHQSGLRSGVLGRTLPCLVTASRDRTPPEAGGGGTEVAQGGRSGDRPRPENSRLRLLENFLGLLAEERRSRRLGPR